MSTDIGFTAIIWIDFSEKNGAFRDLMLLVNL